MKKTSRHDLKRLCLCFFILYLLVTLLPPALYRAVPGPEASPPEQGASPEPEASAEPSASPSPLPGPLEGSAEPSEEPSAEPAGDVFTLRDASTGELMEVEARDFLMGDLACEMDLNAPKEALKAQAVAAYTYYSRMRASDGEIPCDPASWLVYAGPEQMQERWGEDWEEYRAVLEEVVDEVLGQTLTYEGELILAAYFAISPGSTEAVENVWAADSGPEHPYLQAVASPGDAFSDGYLSYADFTLQQMQEAFPDSNFSGEPEGWVTDIERTPSGMVQSAKVGGVEQSGTEIRSALGLRSACFDCEPDGDMLRFTVKGWGHGVGMSQAGAVFMAKRGAGYREILEHYYPGAVLG